MKKRKWNVLFTLAVPLALAGGAVAMLDPLGFAASSRTVYSTSDVSRGQIRKLVSTSGPVRALVTVSVGSQLSGQIESVNADFNTEVTPGQLLAQLDARTFAAKVDQAIADLAAAKAALANQEAAMAKSQAVLKAAETNVERQGLLAKKRLSTQLTYETAVRDRDVAQADIQVMTAQIASAKATIAQKQAALDQAKADLERTKIQAPIEGTVISRTVDPGQTVAASLQAPELFKIAQDLSRIRIEAQVNEADVGAVSKGNPVTFQVDAYPDREFEGRVTQVRLAATELENVVTYTVIIEAANQDRKLFPGMTANVLIEAERRDDVLRVTNDVFRFKPRNQARPERRLRRGGKERMDRRISRLKVQLQLTGDQEQALRQAIGEVMADMKGPQSGMGRSARRKMRQKMQLVIETTLQPLLSDAQRPLFEKWKTGRRSRVASVYVMGPDREPERRMVRVGIADDQHTEILGGRLREGDQLITRAREVK